MWQEWFHNLLLTLSRRRYTLIVSEKAPLGATDFTTKTVEVNPVSVIFPRDRLERKQVRHAPSSRPKWQQAITAAVVQHEAGHIRYSGSKPNQPVLGWLWNALEDERIERLLAAAYPQMKASFEFLNDAVWYRATPTQNLLAGCLLWRWECDRVPDDRKFYPATPEDLNKWSEEIRPLVEKAWIAETSDEVTEIARAILQRLGIPEDASLGNDLPVCPCGGTHGERGFVSPVQEPASTDPLPLPPVGSKIPGYSSAKRVKKDASVSEASPEAQLSQVEGYARDLAVALKPPFPIPALDPIAAGGKSISIGL